jgi:hypothetical protein
MLWRFVHSRVITSVEVVVLPDGVGDEGEQLAHVQHGVVCFNLVPLDLGR